MSPGISELSVSGLASNFCSLQPIRRSECTLDYLRDLEMPQDVSEFRCYQNPKDLQESDYIGKLWTVRAVQNRIGGNDDDDDDDDEVRVVPNMGECTVRPVTTSLLSPISSQAPPSPPK